MENKGLKARNPAEVSSNSDKIRTINVIDPSATIKSEIPTGLLSKVETNNLRADQFKKTLISKDELQKDTQEKNTKTQSSPEMPREQDTQVNQPTSSILTKASSDFFQKLYKLIKAFDAEVNLPRIDNLENISPIFEEIDSLLVANNRMEENFANSESGTRLQARIDDVYTIVDNVEAILSSEIKKDSENIIMKALKKAYESWPGLHGAVEPNQENKIVKLFSNYKRDLLLCKNNKDYNVVNIRYSKQYKTITELQIDSAASISAKDKEFESNFAIKRRNFLDAVRDNPDNKEFLKKIETLFTSFYSNSGKDELPLEQRNAEYEKCLNAIYKEEGVEKWHVVTKGKGVKANKTKIEINAQKKAERADQLKAALSIKNELRNETPATEPGQKVGIRNARQLRRSDTATTSITSTSDTTTTVTDPTLNQNPAVNSTNTNTSTDTTTSSSTSSSTSTTSPEDLAKAKLNQEYYDKSVVMLKEVANKKDHKEAALVLIRDYLKAVPHKTVDKEIQTVIALAGKMNDGVQASKILLVTLQLLIEPTKKNNDSYKALGLSIAKNKPSSKLAQAMCVAMMALSAALITVGALILTGTLAVVPAVGMGLAVAGSAALLASGFGLFKVRKDTDLKHKFADNLNEGINNLAVSLTPRG